MAVRFVSGDIFCTEAQTITQGCNCRGRMGAGIALEFKRRYPEMFKEYKYLCHKGLFVPSGHFLYKMSSPWILNFATQDTIGGAKIEFVEKCLSDFSEYYTEKGITSLAMPRIAAGLGGIEWQDIKQLIFKVFDPMEIPIYVYEVFQQEIEANKNT